MSSLTISVVSYIFKEHLNGCDSVMCELIGMRLGSGQGGLKGVSGVSSGRCGEKWEVWGVPGNIENVNLTSTLSSHACKHTGCVEGRSTLCQTERAF